MPKPYSLIIFDCDGVLVDSERLMVRVDAMVLAAMGWPLSEAEIVRRFVGRPHEYMTEQLGRHLGRSLPLDWDREYAGLYRQALDNELEPVPGIVAALDTIPIPSCVASSGTPEKMAITLGHCGLLDRFQGRILSTVEVAQGKPAPDLFLHAASRMGADPSRCAVIEDSVWGVEAGRAAGMDVYAYAGGVTSADVLRRPGVVVFDQMVDPPGRLTRCDV